MGLIPCVCFCAAENCYAKLLTTSLKRHSQRLCSFTSSVDIAQPRKSAVTLVTHRARLVTVCSSCSISVCTLVQLFDLMDLEKRHNMQGSGGLSTSSVSLAS